MSKNKIRSFDFLKIERNEQKKTDELSKIKAVKQKKSKLKKSRKKIQLNDDSESDDEFKGDSSSNETDTKVIAELPVHKLSSPFEDLSTLLREKALMRK